MQLLNDAFFSLFASPPSSFRQTFFCGLLLRRRMRKKKFFKPNWLCIQIHHWKFIFEWTNKTENVSNWRGLTKKMTSELHSNCCGNFPSDNTGVFYCQYGQQKLLWLRSFYFWWIVKFGGAKGVEHGKWMMCTTVVCGDGYYLDTIRILFEWGLHAAWCTMTASDDGGQCWGKRLCCCCFFLPNDNLKDWGEKVKKQMNDSSRPATLSAKKKWIWLFECYGDYSLCA